MRSKPHNDILNEICGNTGYESRDVIHEVTFKHFHSSPTLLIEFTDTLDQPADLESWGLSYVIVEYWGQCEG